MITCQIVSLLMPCRFQWLNLGREAGQYEPLPLDPSCWPNHSFYNMNTASEYNSLPSMDFLFLSMKLRNSNLSVSWVFLVLWPSITLPVTLRTKERGQRLDQQNSSFPYLDVQPASGVKGQESIHPRGGFY